MLTDYDCRKAEEHACMRIALLQIKGHLKAAREAGVAPDAGYMEQIATDALAEVEGRVAA